MASVNETKSFTRPDNSTAYSIGDLIANSATAGDVEALAYGASGTAWRLCRRIRLHKTTAGVTGASFRAWVLNAEPTVTNGDNGALAGNFSASVVGVFEGETPYVLSDGVTFWLEPVAGDLYESGPLWILLEARGAYEPGAEEVFSLTLEQVDA